MKQSILHPLFRLLLFLICLPALAQQPTLEWAQRYHGTSEAVETALGFAVDAEGNSYVTGLSESHMEGTKTTTVKYSPLGEELWVVHEQQMWTVYETSYYLPVIAVDNAGGVYITGSSTIRYDAATGQQTWSHPTGATDIAIDNAGGVYVTSNDTIDNVLLIQRFDAATGQQTWSRKHDRSQQPHIPDNSTDRELYLTVGNGGLFILGVTTTPATEGNFREYFLASYDAATGEQIWDQPFGEEPDASALPRGIAVDNEGSVYVIGVERQIIQNRLSNDRNYLTVRYNATTGEQVWAARYYGGERRMAYISDITVDNSGGVYVTGEAYERDHTESFYATIRYAAVTGQQDWVRRYKGPSSYSGAKAVIADNAGGVYVTGNSHLGPAEEAYIGTVRYDAVTGEQTWAQNYSGPAFGDNEKVTAIALDNTGGLYLTGSSEFDYLTIRYAAATGTRAWTRRYNVPTSSEATPIAVAVDAAGNSYVTGDSRYSVRYTTQTVVTQRIETVKYSPEGEQLWVTPFEDYEGIEQFSSAAAIAVDDAGGVYVTGYIRAFSETYYATIRYDAATGEQTWVQRYDGLAQNDQASAIAVDNAGGVYVTGPQAFIRYNAATGEQTWSYPFKGATTLAVDNTGGLYIPGRVTARYDAATRELTWGQVYNDQISDNNRIEAIAVDNLGGLYITRQHTTVRYNAATGEQTWVQRYGSTNADIATAMTVDSAGGVFVTGKSSGDGTGSNYLTVRYDAATGEQTWEQQFANKTNGAVAIAVDNAGRVYVTGTSDFGEPSASFATVRYDAATGEQTWFDSYSAPGSTNNEPVDMALDGEGNIIITGLGEFPDTGMDYFTIKYSQQAQCPELAEAAISGSTTAAAGSSGSVYTLSGSGASSFAWSITGSDGSTFTDFTGQGSNAITIDWSSEPDVFKVSVTYSGGEGCPGRVASHYVHIFDPVAGFVTGGGWFHSPVSTAYEYMQSEGRVYLGLSARYRRGSENQVQGATLILLENAAFTFRSTSYEARALVISGNTAFYRGRGSVTYVDAPASLVTDERQFGFLVAATDGQLNRGTAQDKFRLKVWAVNPDGSQGPVVYDSQAACPSASLDDNALPCTDLERGNIIIHKPRSGNIFSTSSLPTEAAPGAPGLEVYPTAVSDRATLRFSLASSDDYTLELYDMKGALVKRIAAGAAEAGRNYEQEFSVEGVGNGLYIARLSTGTEVQTVKLVVER
ncbi:SBBP repeat-containing protein [Pontibacter pamirensis]|uniref:SBBP repeat-containing protein n=1 Tax=Pontibacter pamirensis TaxID=2562824 RepID=UPI0013895D09|nr:SBBP repeat-containing protein [Pontibacter pamirensis]